MAYAWAQKAALWNAAGLIRVHQCHVEQTGTRLQCYIQLKAWDRFMKVRISKWMSRDTNDHKIILARAWALESTLFTCTDGDISVENKTPRLRTGSTAGKVWKFNCKNNTATAACMQNGQLLSLFLAPASILHYCVFRGTLFVILLSVEWIQQAALPVSDIFMYAWHVLHLFYCLYMYCQQLWTGHL